MLWWSWCWWFWWFWWCDRGRATGSTRASSMAHRTSSARDRKAPIGNERVAPRRSRAAHRPGDGSHRDPPACRGLSRVQRSAPRVAFDQHDHSDKAAMMRLRAGNTPGRGSVPRGCSLTTAPCTPTAAHRADWFRGYGTSSPVPTTATGSPTGRVCARPRYERHRRCPWPVRTQRLLRPLRDRRRSRPPCIARSG